MLGSVVAASEANGKPRHAFEDLALVKAPLCMPEAQVGDGASPLDAVIGTKLPIG